MKLAFAIEDNVGNTTYRKNLAHFIAQREDVQAEFVPVKLIADDIWQLLPVINANYALTASARAASSLHAIDKRMGLDAAFIHSQSIALFGLSFMRKVPTVISSDATPANFDTLAHGYGHEVRGPGMERFKKHWTRATFKAAAKLLGFSEWVKDSYVNDYGADPDKVVVVSSGVDTTLWRPEPAKRAQDGIVRILFIGGDLKRKGGDVLLRWAAETRHRDFELHLVTKDPVPEQARVHAHYGMTSNAPELIELAQRCEVFAFPTRADCYPFGCIEAAAAGMAGVSFALGAIHEIIVDGTTGLLAKAGDDAGFCERLDKLVEDASTREAMGRAARERALSKFDAKTNAGRVIEVMRSISER